MAKKMRKMFVVTKLEFAKWLLREGQKHKMVQKDPRSCAIAQYVKHGLGREETPEVHNHDIKSGEEKIRTPTWAKGFIKRFDRESYMLKKGEPTGKDYAIKWALETVRKEETKGKVVKYE